MLMETRMLSKDQKTDAIRNPKPVPVVSGRQILLDGLNEDLAGEYQAILMYIHYSALLTGPFRRELRSLFQEEISDEQGHAQFLADKIAALGGVPTTQPRPVPHVEQPRAMLEHALAAEKQAIAGYTTRISQAQECGELGLKNTLENQLADETRHQEELERIIAGWDGLNLDRTQIEERWQDDGGNQNTSVAE
jgi:bacterioferritin